MPSAERKSGMPLSVETPAPPKKTIFSDLSIISCNVIFCHAFFIFKIRIFRILSVMSAFGSRLCRLLQVNVKP
jgi:hypothetical protein